MSEAEQRMLERYEERQQAEREENQFTTWANFCSPRHEEFWRPEAGVRYAFGSVEVNGRWCHPAYVIEFMAAESGWWVTLIASRDPGLSCRNATVRVKFTALCGEDPQPTGLSGPAMQFWQVTRDHFGKFWPKRVSRKRA